MTNHFCALLIVSGTFVCACAASKPSSSRAAATASVEIQASSDDDAETVIELGAVNSGAELPFGCHIFVDLMPFTLQGNHIKGASFSATKIRFQLPWDHDKPDGDLEQLDGAVFDEHNLAGNYKIEFINHKLAGYESGLPVELDRLALNRTDNWHFDIDFHGNIAINSSDVVPFRFHATLEIAYLHWPPDGAPNEDIIDLAKSIVGDSTLPTRVIASVCDSPRRFVVHGTRNVDPHRISLIFREMEFKRWYEAIHSRYNIVSGAPEWVFFQMPPDWHDEIIDTALAHVLIEPPQEGYPKTWMIIGQNSHTIHFYSPHGDFPRRTNKGGDAKRDDAANP